MRCYSQVVRQRSAKPLAPVQIWVAPPFNLKGERKMYMKFYCKRCATELSSSDRLEGKYIYCCPNCETLQKKADSLSFTEVKTINKRSPQDFEPICN